MQKNKAPHAEMPPDTALQVRTGRPRRILVNDDDDDIRKFNTSVLALSGYRYHVDAAADGANATFPEEELNQRPWLQSFAALLKAPDQLLGTVPEVLSVADGAPRQAGPPG